MVWIVEVEWEYQRGGTSYRVQSCNEIKRIRNEKTIWIKRVGTHVWPWGNCLTQLFLDI